MSQKNFVDYVKIYFKSGNGGAGAIHFHRAKYVQKGGPDGGDGGRGGNIILRGNKQLWTLLHLKYRKHISATDGAHGRKTLMSGADGEDVIIEVPLGTVAKDAITGEVDLEITQDGEQVIYVPGGRGGLGNANFKSSTNQAPKYAQPGEDGIEVTKILELKVLADVGLVGFPNAGKSTLLSVISAAKPKIGAYEFTTLIPNLGIVSYRDSKSFVMADIPGIIEKAHEGKGLGLRFLRHIERNSALLFLVPSDTDDIIKQYQILLNELQQYEPALLDKPRLLGLSKADLIDDELKEMIDQELPEDLPRVYFSSITNTGLTDLKDKIWELINEE